MKKDKVNVLKLTKKFILNGKLKYVKDLKGIKELPSYNWYVENMGSWENVYKTIGVEYHRKKYTRDEIIKIYTELKKEYGNVTSELFDKKNIDNRKLTGFGSLNKLKIFMGDEIKEISKIKTTKENLKQIYILFSQENGDINGSGIKKIDNLCIYKSNVFISRFGSINELRKECGFKYSNRRTFNIEEIIESLVKTGKIKNKELKEKTGYSENTILRYFKTTKMSEVWEQIEKEMGKCVEEKEKVQGENKKS